MARKRKARRNGHGAEATIASLKEDLAALQADMTKVFSGVGGAASDGMSNAVRAAEDVAEHMETLGHEGVHTVRSTIRSTPLVACAISVGAGALIGALLARQ